MLRFKRLLIIILLIIVSPLIGHAACQVSFQWVSDNGSSISGYRLYCRLQGQSFDYSRPVWEGSLNQCTVDQLNENTVYYFVLRAFDSSGNESSDSNEVLFAYDAEPPHQPVASAPALDDPGVSLTPEMVTSAFSDPDPENYHSATRWQIFRGADDLCVLDVTSDLYLTRLPLPFLILEGSTSYYWQVRHYNEINGISPASNLASFTTLPWLEDRDGDGIPDGQEPADDLDLDQDGQSDAFQNDLKRVQSAYGNMAWGVGLDQNTDSVVLEAAQAMDPNNLTAFSDSLATLPAGLIIFKLLMDQQGLAASVTLYFSKPIPDSDHWIQFDLLNGFQEIAATDAFASDRRSLSLEFQDGGKGDLDGVANGIIVAMGGYGSIATPPTAHLDGNSFASDGSGAACFIESITGP